MKTAYRFIRFQQLSEGFNDHPMYDIVNKRQGNTLGKVFWYAAWRQYVFTQATQDCIFSADCLADIIHFTNQLITTERTTP